MEERTESPQGGEKGEASAELPRPSRFPLSVWVSAAAIALITLLVFSPSLNNGFVNWDDADYVLQNPLVVNEKVPLKEIFQSGVLGNYHPISILTLAWNYQAGKLDPWGYHSWNVRLHVLNTLLVLLFVFLLTNRNLVMAIIVSLFFGIHPMHVESVSWVSERKDVLYVFFFLAGLVSYLFYRKSGKARWYVVTLALFILSCLSKAMAVVFPAILLLIDYLQNTEWRRKVFIEKLPFVVLAIVFGILAIRVQQHQKAMDYMETFTVVQRLVFASHGAVMYSVRLFAPFNLAAFYPYPIVRPSEQIPLVFYASPLLLIGTAAVMFFFFRKEKEVIFGLLFYLFSVVLVLQFIPVGRAIMADRYTYLSYIGLSFVAAHWVNVSWTRKSSRLAPFRHAITGIVLTAAFLFGYQTHARTKVWANSETLWTDAIEKYPTAGTAFLSRGKFYQFEKKDMARAFQDYNRALEIDGSFQAGYNNRGMIHAYWGQRDAALTDYNKALSVDPKYANAYNNRGNIYLKQGNVEGAIADYGKAIEFNPRSPDQYLNRGVACLAIGQYEDGIKDLTKCIQLNPRDDGALVMRARCYFRLKLFDKALADCSRATELKPSEGIYWLGLSIAESALGKTELAEEHAAKARQLGAHDPIAAGFR